MPQPLISFRKLSTHCIMYPTIFKKEEQMQILAFGEFEVSCSAIYSIPFSDVDRISARSRSFILGLSVCWGLWFSDKIWIISPCDGMHFAWLFYLYAFPSFRALSIICLICRMWNRKRSMITSDYLHFFHFTFNGVTISVVQISSMEFGSSVWHPALSPNRNTLRMPEVLIVWIFSLSPGVAFSFFIPVSRPLAIPPFISGGGCYFEPKPLRCTKFLPQ